MFNASVPLNVSVLEALIVPVPMKTLAEADIPLNSCLDPGTLLLLLMKSGALAADLKVDAFTIAQTAIANGYIPFAGGFLYMGKDSPFCTAVSSPATTTRSFSESPMVRTRPLEASTSGNTSF
ncbi:SubName: Full=Uncharacterized protein {ECO:0000313/EMBL:CCA73100.1} [Serendipita indica DSM 11827]|nr:SubName: Full=Uncharacterized protein {ECO:0000313/EMBL:CCA73100.1} [Serendipita indica DSM 11827]